MWVLFIRHIHVILNVFSLYVSHLSLHVSLHLVTLFYIPTKISLPPCDYIFTHGTSYYDIFFPDLYSLPFFHAPSCSPIFPLFNVPKVFCFLTFSRPLIIPYVPLCLTIFIFDLLHLLFSIFFSCPYMFSCILCSIIIHSLPLMSPVLVFYYNAYLFI